jgi:nicotinamide mononucleotide transporter
MPSLSRRSIDLALEVPAVIFSLAYTWMYLKGHIPWCYAPATLAGIAFAVLCYRKRIYAEVFLHIFYILMAAYGALGIDGFEARTLSGSSHVLWIGLGTIGTTIVAWVLRNKTDAKLPILDAFTTVFALIATWLMVNYVHENWLYWIIIDGLAIALYAFRRMYFGALLYVFYLLMAIDGYFEQIHWF